MSLWVLTGAERSLAYLPRGLMAHCQRTSSLAYEMAERFGEEPQRAAWVGLVHDLARPYPGRKPLSLAREYGLPINEIEMAILLLLHGPVGAEVLRWEWGVGDVEVLEAVRWHTTGCPDMRRLAKIVFLADKLEPGKARLYPHIDKVRELVATDLEAALLEFLRLQIDYLECKGQAIHPAMIQARDSLG